MIRISTIFALQLSLLCCFSLPITAISDNCIDCHSNSKFRIQNPKLFKYYNDWQISIHHKAGVSCSDCHGGDPEAQTKKVAHNGGFLPSNPNSKVHYKNLPKTCGQCHQDIYQNFTESLHFKALGNDENAPHCSTCHGSINSKTYFTSIVRATCQSCHNGDNPKTPQILDEAEQILRRINIAKGYLGWTQLYYEHKGESASADLAEYKQRYKDLSDNWHQFKFDTSSKDSVELLATMREIYDKASREIKSAKPPAQEQ